MIGLSNDIMISPMIPNSVKSQKARLYPPVVSKMWPVIIGPMEPPPSPMNMEIPKMAPWDLIPKYSATIGEKTVNSPPWAKA